MQNLFNLSVFFILIKSSCSVEICDADLTTPELISKYGYKCETHFVTTKDGYVLQLHRIVSSPKVQKSHKPNNKHVVFMMHGLSASSGDFIIAGPEVSLGYYLSDLDYDVWLGNSRGNRYSRNHTTISPENSIFWDFTFHEMGVYDLPASVDYILSTTNHQTLSYIGYSEGTTIFFVMCSERPGYQRKINFMQAMGPVVFLYRTQNIVIRIVGHLTNIEIKRLKKAPYELFPHSKRFSEFVKAVCSSPAKQLCSAILFEFAGVDHKYFDENLLIVAAGHTPSGTSNRNVAHFGQLAEQDRFGMFDFGSLENIKIYGQLIPPTYNIANITVPVMLIYSQNDRVSFPKDIFKLRDTLLNMVDYHEPLYKKYNHADLIIGKCVREILYTRMAAALIRYSRE